MTQPLCTQIIIKKEMHTIASAIKDKTKKDYNEV